MFVTQPTDSRAQWRSDLMLVIFLIGIDVLARILPHMPNFTPVAATALFAGTVLRHRPLALLVPLAALLISDFVIGFDDWRITLVTYAALMLPALVAFMPRGFRAPGMFVPVMIACSLIFFAVTNFATWAFSNLYPHTLEGLAACYVLALPFLEKTLLGDLGWALVLFGGAWMIRTALTRTHGVALR